ncbi:YlbF family regulator [Streptococcus dentasini]
MANLEEATKALQRLLAQHESVQAFHAVQNKVEQLPELRKQAHAMKAYQQEAVLFEKLEKRRAANQSGQTADQLEQELAQLPLVQDYREKMQDASDLLQYVTSSIEEKINEELGNGKR